MSIIVIWLIVESSEGRASAAVCSIVSIISSQVPPFTDAAMLEASVSECAFHRISSSHML